DFSKTEDVDDSLADIQSQPSVHRFLLDTSVPGNYQHLRAKAFGHAVLRMVSKQGFPEGEDYSLQTRLAQLYPDAPNMDAQAILQNLCSSETDFWLQVRLAEFDLALQIIAPSIYSDPLKVSALIQGEASALPHPMGYSLNINGMNNVTRRSLDYLSKNFHMVGLQETCFTGLRTFKRAKHIWSEASRFNTSFWSQDHMTNYTGHAGVGLLLTPTCPVQDLQDVTLRHVSSSELLQRYLVLQGTLNTVVTYIHVVYAPVQSGERPTFFNQLPRNFEEGAQHIVMGDFNTVLSSQCDQALHNNRERLQGRAQLQDWMQELNAVDAWRLQHPTLEEYTSPNSSSRVDYVMMSSQLFHAALRDIRHDFRQSANAGDHCGIKFHLGSAIFRPTARAPWRCPEWVIQLPEAQMYLHESLEEFADSIHDPTNAEYNPGCLLDEHMRHDSIFLRELFQSKKNIRQNEIEELHLSINRLRHLQHTEPSADQERTLQEKQETLKIKLKEKEYYASQKKFISDLRSSERCSQFFFRPPQVLHNTPIPVNSKEELDSMCTAFNEYWSGIYKSPSKEYRHVKPKWDRMKMAQILKHTTARLTSAQMAYLDSPFTANEFYGAIKHTTKGKAPGPDGLPLAYYLTDLPLWC
ncbi:hypothetical protein BBJ28_00025698, partial [Nothophytophthora sp. Chile5]